MAERLGEMRKGKRERIEKGSREGIKKRERDKRQFEVKEFSRSDSAMYIVSSSSQGMTSWSSSIKICFFYKLIECIIKKKCMM